MDKVLELLRKLQKKFQKVLERFRKKSAQIFEKQANFITKVKLAFDQGLGDKDKFVANVVTVRQRIFQGQSNIWYNTKVAMKQALKSKENIPASLAVFLEDMLDAIDVLVHQIRRGFIKGLGYTKGLGKRVKALLIELLVRALSMLSWQMALVEMHYFFSQRVLLYQGDPFMQEMFNKYVKSSLDLHVNYPTHWSVVCLVIYIIFALDKIPLITKKLKMPIFLRINVVQAFLWQIIISAIGQTYLITADFIRIGPIGGLVANVSFWGVLSVVAFSMFVNALGRHPIFPIVTEATLIQISKFDEMPDD